MVSKLNNRVFPKIDYSDNAARIVLVLKFVFLNILIIIWLQFGKISTKL